MEDRFKEKCTIEQRINESARIKAKYPERVPVIVERADGCKNIEEITKHKYLVPNDLTIGQFAYVIRKKNNLPLISTLTKEPPVRRGEIPTRLLARE